jgi:transcriptional antiterminator NusG
MAHEWYVIQTLSGQEQKVERSLAKRIGDEEMAEYIKEVLVPMEKVVEVRGGKKTTTQRKLYPGYMFMEVNLYDDEGRIHAAPWDFIKNTQGIIGFVGGERPVPTPTDEIAAIQAQIADSEETERPRVNFEVNEIVKINDGPFLNYNGAVEAIDPDSGKLKVTIDIFGRSTPVELEYWQVEKQ